MRIKKLLILSVLSISLAVSLIPETAVAHVLLADTSGKYGAVLHVAPDDNPVAQKITGLYYEVEDVPNLNKAAYKLVVKRSESALSDELTPVASGNTISASYVFPDQGLYLVILDISQPNNQPGIIFNTTIRVSGGVGVKPKVVIPDWAKAGIILSIWIMAILLLIAFKRRKDILKNSQ